jgi:hypothetical protein
MSRKHKFAEKSGAYFISFATVNWIDVFTAQHSSNKKQLPQIYIQLQ